MVNKDLIFLVADDDPDEHYLIHTAIQEINDSAEIHSVFTGFQLFEFLFNKGMYENLDTPMPHVIIVDINMPILNGFDVIKTVKETEQLNDILIYVLTTSDREEDKVKALSLGANGYYTKPNNFDKLKDIMKEIQSKIKK
ncbi:MAG: response regulator [Bacteroidetes bacterium]|nr:response regulator [Bacteroidota bacterium]